MNKKTEKLKQNLKNKRDTKKFTSTSGSVVYMLTESHARTVKIGFARDFQKRMSAYRTHSTSFVILDVMPGDAKLGHSLQKRLEEMGFTKHYNESQSEWFDLPDDMPKKEIFKGFKIFEEIA